MSDRILADPPERTAEAPEPEPKAPPPVKSTPETAPDEPETPEPASKEAEGEEEAPAEPTETPEEAAAAKARKDLHGRIKELTQEKWEHKRNADALAARLAELERPQPQPGQAADPVEVAKHQLRMEAAQREFNQRCNDTFAAGKSEYPDFEAAVSAMMAVGAGNRPDFLAAVTQLPEGHRVYRQLASNLDDAARVLALPPMQMAVELARMEARLAGGTQERRETEAPKSLAPPVSSAPPPIRPIGGGSRALPTVSDPKVSMADFIRIRDREEAERRRM